MIEPYGGTLVDLVVTDRAALHDLAARVRTATPLRLSARSLCDLELLATGGLSPLTTFMGQADYRSVLRYMRLANGLLYPVPVTLPLPDALHCRRGHRLALQDRNGETLALMTVDEIFDWDCADEARAVCGTTDPRHPLVAEMNTWPGRYVSGPLIVMATPRHDSFRELRHRPRDTRAILQQLGHDRVVAFQTRNPMHRVHEELTKRAASRLDAALLIHPVVGQTKPGDIDPHTRVLCYRELVARYYDPGRTVLSLLPLAMRMAGPREALWHTTIRRNYGATHLIVGRDHAGPGVDSTGRPFYDPYAAQELVQRYEQETGVTAVAFEELVYEPREDAYVERSRLNGRSGVTISGTEVRETYLAHGRPLPGWFTRPEIAALLATNGLVQRGFCVWLAGLSGSGKSTIAAGLASRLTELGHRPLVLDGDRVRAQAGPRLGFSRRERDENVLRIAAMAADGVRDGHIAVCAVIAPYADARARARDLVGRDRFVLVHVATPLDVCERRDPKGLYARARRGEISSFTGIDDPFEPPRDAEVTVDASSASCDQAVETILRYLMTARLLPVPDLATATSTTESAPCLHR